MLMYANMAIDAIQSGKKNWVNSFVHEKTVAAPLNDFVEAQTVFTKQIAKTVWEATGAFADAIVSKSFKA
jgi:hypothetical protein